MKQVAIILLNWNGWRDTLACLASLEKLDYSNYRVLVIDNASTDDSVTHIQTAYPDIPLIINDRNLGFGGGCNVGIVKAMEEGADYIWLLNNDTEVAPSALTAMVNVAGTDARIGAVGSVLYYMDAPGKVQAWGGGHVNFWLGLARNYDTHVPENRLHYLTGASLLLRREAQEQVGLFDEKFFMYWEDTDLGFRLRKKGWRLAVAEGSCIWHKESASLGKKSSLLVMYFNASAVLFFSKHAVLPVIPILVGVSSRMIKSLVMGNWKRAIYTLKGVSAQILEMAEKRNK
jgi:GT2 family glycosyltransferase